MNSGKVREGQFSSADVISFVRQHEGHRLTLGMLQYYVDNAFLQPRRLADEELRKAGCRGRPCTVYYSTTDLILVRWMARLGKDGVSLRKFAGALRALRRLLPDALSRADELKFFVLDRNREVGVSLDGTAIKLSGEVGQVLLTFPMTIAVETVKCIESDENMIQKTNGGL